MASENHCGSTIISCIVNLVLEDADDNNKTRIIPLANEPYIMVNTTLELYLNYHHGISY